MRILVISDLYPPVSFGGYEMECKSVVDHLCARHDVHVLTSERNRRLVPPARNIWRELPYSGRDRRSAFLAPWHAQRAVGVVRRLLAIMRPELVFIWNANAIPTSGVRVAVDHGVAVAHRLCEGWFAQRVLLADHFLRYLALNEGGVRGVWGRALRLVNRHPRLRLDACAPYDAAVSWNSRALRDRVGRPPAIRPLLERTIHPATSSGDYFATLERRPSERPTILFVGRLWPAKGVDVAVRALALLEQRHGIRADLVLAGPYSRGDRADVVGLAAAMGIEDRLEFLGRLGAERLGAALQQAHALVAPSTAEAFGLACVEAAAARVPVVASRVDGIPEALQDGDHALLFDVGDADGCAAALAEVVTGGAETRARVARAFARARELSLERYLRATDEFLAATARAFAVDAAW